MRTVKVAVVSLTLTLLATFGHSQSLTRLPTKCVPAASSPYTCNTGNKGRCYTNTTDSPNRVYWCNGTSWLAGADVSTPVFAGTITSTQGTIVADTPFFSGTSTWNNGGVTFTAFKFNVTDTASASGSLLMDLRVGNATKFSVDKNGVVTGSIYIATPQSFTVADDGAGTAASATLTPTSTAVGITCNDANGCNITMGETGMVSGYELRIVNLSANVCNFADTSGVSETAGAFAMGQYDAITYLYAVDRWVEMNRSNN